MDALFRILNQTRFVLERDPESKNRPFARFGRERNVPAMFSYQLTRNQKSQARPFRTLGAEKRREQFLLDFIVYPATVIFDFESNPIALFLYG